ncbi:hypothetical protein CRG98_027385 [Punica granatum]|uniref:Uncharacterized protein n=1 Tax=Punica granatum TaxID=22663 RepID=A0A2I0J8J2_PUNGR|nr:hypothetical protein CRG98_027385 [Punica granatum]
MPKDHREPPIEPFLYRVSVGSVLPRLGPSLFTDPDFVFDFRKIYACSPPKTTIDAILILLGIQHNWPRAKIPSRSTGTAPTSRTASRICHRPDFTDSGLFVPGGKIDFPKPFFRLSSTFPASQGKPMEPLGLTPREVAESSSWLPRAMDGLLSPTQVVS